MANSDAKDETPNEENKEDIEKQQDVEKDTEAEEELTQEESEEEEELEEEEEDEEEEEECEHKNYTYKSNHDGTHKVYCADCGEYLKDESCKYDKAGKCIHCGYEYIINTEISVRCDGLNFNIKGRMPRDAYAEIKAVDIASVDDILEDNGKDDFTAFRAYDITNLINRFYDIADGKIRYDGININKIKKADLRRSLGIVLQDTHLFTGTIADNIRYGKLDATGEEVIAAAKLANADGFIRRLPQGYDTVIKGDGGNLSQGQRQLLAIARAAIADPPVLILDEATSSIDTRTEKIVQDGMDKLMSGRTTFVIAHRLSTIRNSDCIMVLDQGRIIERGSHEELIQEGGKYYQLYTGKIQNA